MLKKVFSNKQEAVTDIFIKKTVADNIYSKFYIRKLLKKDSKDIKILDKDNSFFNLKINKSLKAFRGHSCSYNVIKYQHQANKALKFLYLTNLTQRDNKIKNLYSLFYRLKKKGGINGSLFITRKIKGGFEGASFGVKGFLPQQQGAFLLKKAFCNSLSIQKSADSFKKFNFYKKDLSLSSNMLIQRLPTILNVRKGLAFLRKKQTKILNQNKDYFDFVFTNSLYKNFFYAHKKRIKNKTFKFEDKKFGGVSAKTSSKFKKNSRKKNFEISNS